MFFLNLKASKTLKHKKIMGTFKSVPKTERSENLHEIEMIVTVKFRGYHFLLCRFTKDHVVLSIKRFTKMDGEILCEKESVANSKNRKPSEQQCIEYNVADQNNFKKQYLLDKLLLDKSGTYLCHIFSAIQLGIGGIL